GVAAFLLLYLVARALLDRSALRSLGLNSARLAGTLAAGALLTAIQAAPYLESLRHGSYLPATVQDLKLSHLATLLFPHLFGDSPLSMAAAGNGITPRIAGLVHVGLA